MSAVRTKKSGFTLVEILIVVIILGILAAIVIPQFTDASTSAKQNSLVSQVQTVRSQVELYKSAHSSTGATKLFTTASSQWQELTKNTDLDGTLWVSGTSTGTKFGPYLQNPPVNNINSRTNVVIMAVPDETTTSAATVCGYIYDDSTGKFWATDTDSKKIYLAK